MQDALLREAQAAAFCGLSPAYLRTLRKTGRGPAFVRPSPHTTLYRTADLEAWRNSWPVVQPKPKA